MSQKATVPCSFSFTPMVTIESIFSPQNPLGIKSPSFLGWDLPLWATERGKKHLAHLMDIWISTIKNCFWAIAENLKTVFFCTYCLIQQVFSKSDFFPESHEKTRLGQISLFQGYTFFHIGIIKGRKVYKNSGRKLIFLKYSQNFC